jgi:hypothetical protein
MLRIDRDRCRGLGLDQPRELHDRPASRADDRLLDILDRPVDAVALAGYDRYLRGAVHELWRPLVLVAGSERLTTLPSRWLGNTPGGRRRGQCYGGGTGGAVAREVLLADAAESPFDLETAPASEGGDGVKTARERAEEKRLEKLDQVREQVESGALVIRQMTDEERQRYPPRPVQPKRSDKR